jgi:hypothetical protein
MDLLLSATLFSVTSSVYENNTVQQQLGSIMLYGFVAKQHGDATGE